MERDTGIGPATKLWESFVIPVHQSRLMTHYNPNYFTVNFTVAVTVGANCYKCVLLYISGESLSVKELSSILKLIIKDISHSKYTLTIYMLGII